MGVLVWEMQMVAKVVLALHLPCGAVCRRGILAPIMERYTTLSVLERRERHAPQGSA